MSENLLDYEPDEYVLTYKGGNIHLKHVGDFFRGLLKKKKSSSKQQVKKHEEEPVPPTQKPEFYQEYYGPPPKKEKREFVPPKRETPKREAPPKHEAPPKQEYAPPPPKQSAHPHEHHYATLGLTSNASPEEVKRAYKQLSLKHHPDRNKGDEAAATERFKAINNAYSVITGRGLRKGKTIASYMESMRHRHRK
eukprot:gene13048-17489_t